MERDQQTHWISFWVTPHFRKCPEQSTMLMNLARRAGKKAYYVARYTWLRSCGVQWLFILGHMRSGSSLLVHLLNSNPEVLGYGEAPIRYWGRWSFVELHDHVHDKFETHGESPGSRYRYVNPYRGLRSKGDCWSNRFVGRSDRSILEPIRSNGL